MQTLCRPGLGCTEPKSKVRPIRPEKSVNNITKLIIVIHKQMHRALTVKKDLKILNKPIAAQ